MIEQLLFLAANHRWQMLTGWLQDPSRRLLDPAAATNFSPRFEQLKTLLAHRPEVIGLLELRLVADWLLVPEPVSAATAGWLDDIGLMARWLPSAIAGHAAGARWLAVPVLLAGQPDRATVRHLIAGRLQTDDPLPLLAPWAEALCDRDARAAIATAARLAAQPGVVFHVFPLLPPGNRVTLCGPSLGLPLAIGLRQLGAEGDFPPAVAATGVLAEDGTLAPVEALEAKCRAAVSRGFAHLVFPAANGECEGEKDLRLHPAADFNEAAILALLAGKGRCASMQTFARMLADAGAFVAYCDSVPADWIDWAADTRRLDAIRDQLLTNPDVLDDLAQRLERLTEANRISIAASLCRLLLPETVQAAGDALLDSAFRWAVICLALANRRGQVTEAAAWDRTAAGLFERACGIGSPEAMARHANIAFVHREQGRYHFTAQIPETLAVLLRRFEQRAEEDRAMGCPVHSTYGALCGTLAQHYGFCGPEWIQSTEKYIREARRAFGDGAVPGRRGHWLRPLNYRCYARLDAGDFAGAEAALMEYLEAQGWDAVMEKLETFDAWHQALLARFLAEAGPPKYTRRYLDWVVAFCKPVPDGHPWQLWANNLGRMAQRENQPAAAETYYRLAIQRCRHSILGATVQVMTLLPLAGLEALGVRLEGEIAAVRQAAAQLDPDHFRPVFEMDLSALLQMIREEPRRLFPFSYR